ncbi:MAG TPA: amino acid permease [Bdellovibrionales bacterium]|nr:amino acid permease [Bdellovibrionales bacterium]
MTANNGSLNRVFTFWTLLIYGVGDILGAGIYALIGKIAGEAGGYLWLSFLIAMTVALLTGLSYAELGSRFPKSGGAAHFCEQALSPAAGFFAGWVLLCATVVSMATLSRAFVGYLETYSLSLSDTAIIVAFVCFVGLINFRGIKHSSAANIIATTIEISGLLVVLVSAAYFFTQHEFSLFTGKLKTDGVLAGAALAFYAFIGFEDLVNVSEETKNPERTVPRAIVGAVLIAGALYMLVALSAAAVAGPERLAASSAPLVEAVRLSGSGFPLGVFPLIALFAIFNTTLLNYVTASRLLFGMSKEGVIPGWFAAVHPKFRTPHAAIAFIFPIVIGVSLLGNLAYLASATSGLVLTAFALVNLSLIVVHWRASRHEGFRAPRPAPYAALALNLAAFFYLNAESLKLVAVILATGAAAALLMRMARGHALGGARRA